MFNKETNDDRLRWNKKTRETGADASRLVEFIEMIARMETADEFDERTNDEGMSGDDAVDALSGLVRQARELLSSSEGRSNG